MLVLTRKKDEGIRIGDEITIKVIALKGGGVRLGIEAPVEIPVVRSELLPGDRSGEDFVDEYSLESDSSEEELVLADGI